MSATVTQTLYSEARTTTDLHRLGELAVDDDYKVRAWVAANPVCPPEYLAYLSGDDNANVLRAVADNGNTPSEILGVLARNPKIVSSVAANGSTSTSTLREIADRVVVQLRSGAHFDDVAHIVCNMCSNRNSDVYVLTKIVNILSPEQATIFSLIALQEACTPQLAHKIAEKLVTTSYGSRWASSSDKTAAIVIILDREDLLYDTLKVIATRQWPIPQLRVKAIEQMMLSGEHEGWPQEWLEELYVP